VIYKPVN